MKLQVERNYQIDWENEPALGTLHSTAASPDGAIAGRDSVPIPFLDTSPASLSAANIQLPAGACDLFAHESALDEMAAEFRADPLELRRKLMRPHPVALKLLDAIEIMSDWKSPLPGGRARGFAFTLSFGTWVAEVVEVAATGGAVRVEKVFCAADAGLLFDERHFRAQMIASIVNALSAAIGRKMSLPEGLAGGSDLACLDPSELHPCPEIEVELLSNARRLGGATEPPVPPVMPALANAVSALTGRRVRRMPLAGEIAFV